MNDQAVFPEWRNFLGGSGDKETAGFIKSVVKRSGDIASYDRKKIESAIDRAIEAVEKRKDPERAEKLTDAVEERLRLRLAGSRTHSIPAIEEIQDDVESVLIENNEVEIAKAYILYRARHEAIRDAKSLMLDINKTMDEYLSRSDWRVKENANVNFSLGGLILSNSGAVTANYWLNNIYPKEVADAHKTAAFHIHDLSMFSGYCAGWSLRQLIQEGLGGVPDKITSTPATHLSTLVNQMVNFLGIMQNEWAGAQAFSSFDTYLAPFVKIDNLSEKSVRQCIQSFLFGVNTPSRWGSQAPFTNVTLDWVCPDDLKNKKAIVGGEEQEFTYGDCQKEMDIINKQFILLMLEGDASGRGFGYPIPTYNITKNFEWESENAELLFKMASQYGTPYFQNFVNSDLNPSDVRSMCCRLRLDKRELRKRGGGLFGSDEFTGSLGVVTINLPQIGFLAKDEKAFFKRLSAHARQPLQYDRALRHERMLPQFPRHIDRRSERQSLCRTRTRLYEKPPRRLSGIDGRAFQPRSDARRKHIVPPRFPRQKEFPGNHHERHGRKPLLYEFDAASRRLYVRHLRSPRFTGKPADAIHRRHGFPYLYGRTDKRLESVPRFGKSGYGELPRTLRDDFSDLFDLPKPRLFERRTLRVS